MAVPDTTTFNLLNVINELSLASDEGLGECFADAVSGSFDSSYNPNSYGTNNNLLNFRNYGAVTAFFTSVSVAKVGVVCNSTANVASWHNGSSSLPAVNDTVYTNSAGTTTKPAGNYHISTTSAGSSNFYIVVNSSGVVTSKSICP